MHTRTMKQSGRNENIEILRIISMLLIIAHHMILHGGVLDNSSNSIVSLLASVLLFPGGKICLVTFIVISAWYFTKIEFCGSRFLKVYISVIFYNFLGLFLATIFNKGSIEISLRNWIGCFFPISGNSHGFIVAYLIFLLIIPLLQVLSQKMNNKNIVAIVMLCFVLQYVTKVVYAVSAFKPYVNIQNEMYVFIIIYFAVEFLQRNNFCYSRKICQCLLVALWLIIGICNALGRMASFSFLKQVSAIFLNDESSIFNIIAGFCLFLLFYNMKKRKKTKIVSFFAPHTLAVLLIHDNNYFRYVLWNDAIPMKKLYDKSAICFVISSFMIVVIIYSICTFIDKGRILIENALVKSNWFQNVSLKLDSLFKINREG